MWPAGSGLDKLGLKPKTSGESGWRIKMKQVVEERTWRVSEFRFSGVPQHSGENQAF